MVNITAKTDVLFYRDNKLNPQSFTMENEFHYLVNNILLEGADRSSYSMLGDDPLLVTPIKKVFFDGILDGLGKFALGVAAGLAGVACVAVVVGTGGLALAAAGVVSMSTVGSAVMGAFVVGGISVVVSEVINRGRGVELNQEESFKMGISAAVIGESATQIMDREFRPMDFGLTIGMEVIFYGIGKGIVKVKAMKAEGRSLIPKNIDVKQALKSATNKAKKEIADGLQNGVDEVSKFLSKINSQQFKFAPVGGSNNYKFECEMPKNTNPLYEGSITQFAAESTKKVVKSGKNFIDVKTTTKNSAEESTGKTNGNNKDLIRVYRDIDDNLLNKEYEIITKRKTYKTIIKADEKLVVDMPFKGKGKSTTNSEGWLRDNDYYFKELYKKHPEYFSKRNIENLKNGYSIKNDATFRKFFPQYDITGLRSKPLLHHHIGGGDQAIAIPQPLHPGSGGIHNVEKSLGIWGKDAINAERIQVFID